MARPKKAEAESRTCWAHVRYTPEEELSVKMNAAAAGVTVAEFVRRRSLGQSVVPPPARVDARLLTELNAIGNNLNQIARDVNTGREYRGDWEAVLAEFNDVLDKVARRYDS